MRTTTFYVADGPSIYHSDKHHKWEHGLKAQKVFLYASDASQKVSVTNKFR